jgi:acyl carrier protein
MNTNISETIRQNISEHFDIPQEKLTDDITLSKLGFSGLDLEEALLVVEEALDISIKDELLTKSERRANISFGRLCTIVAEIVAINK